jgi:hypothetical protein
MSKPPGLQLTRRESNFTDVFTNATIARETVVGTARWPTSTIECIVLLADLRFREFASHRGKDGLADVIFGATVPG